MTHLLNIDLPTLTRGKCADLLMTEVETTEAMDKQEKDEMDEEPDQDRVLRSIVRNALENKGVLSQIRAMLRAAVFTCVDEHEQTLGIYSPNSTAGEVKNNPEGLLCLQIVIDFLLHFRLNQTLSILKVETNLGEEDSHSGEGRRRMAALLGIDVDKWDDGRPLLMQLLLDRKTHTPVTAAPQREGRDDERKDWRGSGDASAAGDEPGHRQGCSRGDMNTTVSADDYSTLVSDDSDEDATDGGYAGPEAEIDPEVEAMIDAQTHDGGRQDPDEIDAAVQNVDTDDEGRNHDTQPRNRDRDRQGRIDPRRHDGLVDSIDADGVDDTRVVEGGAGDGASDCAAEAEGDGEGEEDRDGGRRSVLHPGITLRRRTSDRASSASDRHPADSEALEQAASEIGAEIDGAVRLDPAGGERAFPGPRYTAPPGSGEQPHESRADGNDRAFRYNETVPVARRNEPDGIQDPVDILEQNRGDGEKERGSQHKRRALEEVDVEGDEADFVYEVMREGKLYEDTKSGTVDESGPRGTPPEGKASSPLAASMASSTASIDGENRGRKRWGVRQEHVDEASAEYRDLRSYGEDETSKTAARFRRIVMDDDDVVENSTEVDAPPRDLLEDYDDEEVAEPAKPPPLPATPSDRPLVAWPRRPDSQTRRAEVLMSAGDLAADYDDELGGSRRSASEVLSGEGRNRPFQVGRTKRSGHVGSNEGRGFARGSGRVQTQTSQEERRGRKEGREVTVTKAAGNGGQSYSFEGDEYGDDEFEEFDGSDLLHDHLDVTVFRPSEDEDSRGDIGRNGDGYETDERRGAIQGGRDGRHTEEESYAEDGGLFDDEEPLEPPPTIWFTEGESPEFVPTYFDDESFGMNDSRRTRREESGLDPTRSGAEGHRSDLEWELGMGSSDDNSSGIRDGSNRVLDDLGYEIESAEDPPLVRVTRAASST